MDLQMMTRQCYKMSSQIPRLSRRYLKKNKIDSSTLNYCRNNLKTLNFLKSYSWMNNMMEGFVRNLNLKILRVSSSQMSKSLKMLKTLSDKMMSCCYLCLIASLKSKKAKMRSLTYLVYLMSCLN